MRNIFRRQTEEANPPALTAEEWSLQKVIDFRQRMAEDPAYKDSFVTAMMGAIVAGNENSFLESVDHSDAYDDAGRADAARLSTELHSIRGSAVLGIVRIITGMAEFSEFVDPKKDAIAVVNSIRSEIGMVTRDAYQQAQNEPPLALQDEGTVAVHYDGFGTVVVWDRVRGNEGLMATLDRNEDIFRPLDGDNQ